MIYLLVGYMWLFIHRPFEVWPWLGALRVERIYMLLTIAYWLTQPKTWTSNRLNVGVGMLAFSIIISTLMSPFEGFESVGVQNWFKLLLFYMLIVTSVRNLEELKVLLIAFVAIMGFYELHSLREYVSGRGMYRMGLWRMIGVDSSMNDPNTFAASVLYGLPLIFPVGALVTKAWHKKALWCLLALGLLCAALTGSRTAFAAVVVFGLGFTFTTRYRWKVVMLVLIAAPLAWINLSEDLQNRYLSLIDPTRGPANAQESAESRGQYFFLAVEVWKERPLLGAGPGGFAYASGTGKQSHSLYAETLSELGSLGVLAVGIMLLGFYRNYREANRIYLSTIPTANIRCCYYTVCATGFAVLLLLFLGLGGHNLFRYTWLWYAAFSALGLKFLHQEAEEIEIQEQEELEYQEELYRDQLVDFSIVNPA